MSWCRNKYTARIPSKLGGTPREMGGGATTLSPGAAGPLILSLLALLHVFFFLGPRPCPAQTPSHLVLGSGCVPAPQLEGTPPVMAALNICLFFWAACVPRVLLGFHFQFSTRTYAFMCFSPEYTHSLLKSWKLQTSTQDIRTLHRESVLRIWWAAPFYVCVYCFSLRKRRSYHM